MFSLSKSLFRLRGLTKLRTSPLYQLYAQASAMSYLNTPRFSFSSQPEKKEEDEVDSHDDFKPKSKVQITEENVFEQIDGVEILFLLTLLYSGSRTINVSYS